MDRKPDWLKKKINLNNININQVKNLIDNSHLHTVCQSAKCPNIFECFGKKTSTFMLMGDICTRNCSFCGVDSGKPEPLDKDEHYRVADAVKKMGLKYVVITSVTRDDLSDGGAAHFADAVREVKKLNPESKVECLIPDFKGNIENLKILLREDPDVLNHNVETIKINYSRVRNKANYAESLSLLRRAKKINSNIFTKSGFIVGLGESREEIKELLSDLKDAGCDIITIGQYLRPSSENVEVSKYYTPQEFKELKNLAESFKFKVVVSGVFVRSSYNAGIVLDKILKKKR